MTITDADRPDPTTGKQASALYAEKYAEYHRATGDTLEYKVRDIDLLIIDALLTDYTLLDVGCATGGHLRLLKNHRRVTAIDFAEATIVKARELQAEFGTERVDFAVSLFETFKAPHKFDAVRLRGTYGAYQPWPTSLHAIDKAREILVDGGIAVASHYLPPNPIHTLKSRLLPNSTLAISTKRFGDLWVSRGFKFLLSIKGEKSTIALWQKL